MILSATVWPLKTTFSFGKTGNSVGERPLTALISCPLSILLAIGCVNAHTRVYVRTDAHYCTVMRRKVRNMYVLIELSSITAQSCVRRRAWLQCV